MTESFSCLWVANTQATLFQRITLIVGRRFGWIVSFPICGSFKHRVGTEKIDKKQPGNVFGAITRIRPNIISTFGTTNVVLNNGITFSVGVCIGISDCDIVLHLVTGSSDSTTFGAVSSIVL